MDITNHMTSSNLERYSFYWLLALLVSSAAALFLGARPPITLITGYSSAIWSLLNVAWIISGVTSVYLTYQWIQHEKILFGAKESKDVAAFGFMMLSGFNIGILGILGTNIYFEIFMGTIVFVITGIISVAVAAYLYKRWQENDKSLFIVNEPVTQSTVAEAKPMQDIDTTQNQSTFDESQS